MDPDKKIPRQPADPTDDMPSVAINDCRRCGTCCEQGGPGFHRQDRMLIETGGIPSKYLYTIRRGEHAYDNVKGCLAPVESDIIKIKGQEGSWTCIFFEADTKSCSIYDDRPLECRALKCWDTGELEQIYDRDRLSRQDILSRVKGLWELIDDHQARCDYAKIKTLIGDIDGPQRARARKELLGIIQYDAEIRKRVVEKGGLKPEMLDFIFGRPLMETLPNYGINVRQEGKKTILTRKPLSDDRSR
jgi:Fe-S-cluster containining protein